MALLVSGLLKRPCASSGTFQAHAAMSAISNFDLGYVEVYKDL